APKPRRCSPARAFVGREDEVAGREYTDRLALADLDRRTTRAVVLGGDRGRALAGAADDDRRSAPGDQAAGAAKNGQQDRRAEPREEVAVDLAADARL